MNAVAPDPACSSSPPAHPGATRADSPAFRLAEGRCHTFHFSPGQSLRLEEGRLLITCENHPADWLLTAGDSFTPPSAGRLVVEALTPARYHFVRGRQQSWLKGFLRRWWAMGGA